MISYHYIYSYCHVWYNVYKHRSDFILRRNDYVKLWTKIKNNKKGMQLTLAELAEKLMFFVLSISKWECDSATVEEIKNNLKFYLNSCYSLKYKINDNTISNDPRFQKSGMKFNNAE